MGADDTGGVPVGQRIPQIAVDDIRAVADRCVGMGGEIGAEIQPVSDDNPGLMCRLRDPEGAVLGLIRVAKAWSKSWVVGQFCVKDVSSSTTLRASCARSRGRFPT